MTTHRFPSLVALAALSALAASARAQDVSAPPPAKALMARLAARHDAQSGIALTNGSDVSPPTLVAFKAGKKLDVTSSTAGLAVDYTVTDNFSGFMYGYLSVTSPSGHVVDFEVGDQLPSLSYTGHATLRLNAAVEPGVWRVTHLWVMDNSGNESNLDSTALGKLGNATFTVANATGADLAAPTLVGGVVQTPSVSLTLPAAGTATIRQEAVVTLHVKDAGTPTPSGPATAYAMFCTPAQVSCFTLPAHLFGPQAGDLTLRVGGLPTGYAIAPGPYALSHVQLTDAAGNSTALYGTGCGGTTNFAALFPQGATITLTP